MNRNSKKALALAVGGLFLSGMSHPAQAGPETWFSSSSSDWTVPGNWSPTGVPGTNDTAIFSTSPIPPLSINGNTTFAQVNIASNETVGAIVSNLANVTAAPNTKGVALTLGSGSASTFTLVLTGQTYQSVPNTVLSNYAGANLNTFDVGGTLNISLPNPTNTILTSVGSGSAAGQTVEIDGNITDSGAGANLNLFGNGTTSLSGGTVQLYGSNNFSGNITVGNDNSPNTGTQGAALQINNDVVGLDSHGNFNGQVLASNTGATGSGTITINDQSQLLLNGTGTTGTLYFLNANQNLVLNGIGENKNSSGDIRTNPGNLNQTYDILSKVTIGSAPQGDGTNGYIIISSTKVATVTIQFSGPVTGSGSLQKQGSGNLEFSNANNDLTGAIQIGNGAITVDPGSSMGTGDLQLFQTSKNFVVIDLNNVSDNAGNLSSQFTDTVNEGSTSADQQFLNLQGPAGDINGAPGTGTTLGLTQTLTTAFGYPQAAGLTTLTSTINGPGVLQLNSRSSGTLSLTGFNTYTGGTILNGGTLNVANGIGQFTPPAALGPIFAGSATGSGDVTVNNNARLTSGGNVVALGEFMNSGSISGNLIVNSGGNVNAGGVGLAGTLAVGGDLRANNGSTFDFDLTGSLKANSDIITIGGNLTLDKSSGTVETINIDGSHLATGQYTLMAFNVLTNSSQLFTLGFLPLNTTRTYSLLPINSGSTSLVLKISGGIDRYWSPGGSGTSNPDGTVNIADGSGTWTDGASDNYFTSPNITNATFANASTNDFVIGNGGSGGLITLGSNITVGDALVLGSVSSPYTIGTPASTNALTLKGGLFSSANDVINAPIILSGSQVFDASVGSSLTIAGVISDTSGSGGGAAKLTKTNLGEVALTGTNTYTGGTVISQGTLQVTSASLPVTGGASVVFGATLDFNQPTNGAYAGLISGSGQVAVDNPAGVSITLANASNSYTGATVLNSGILSVGKTTQLGTGASGITLAGGTLMATAALSFPLTIAGNGTFLNLNAFTTSTINTNGFNVTFGPVPQGSGSLTKTGIGTLTFSTIHSTNVIGELSVLGGAVVFNEGGNPSFGFSGDPTLSNTYTGDLDIAQPTDLRLFSGNFSGGGNVNFTATAKGSVLESRVLNGNNNTVIGNKINLNTGTPVAGYTISILADTLGTLTLANSITGASAVDFTGGKGTVILTGNSIYTGLTTIDESGGGEVQVAVNNALPVNTSVHLTGSGILDLFGFNQTVASIDASSTSGNSTILNESSTGATLTIAGALSTAYNGILEDGQNASLALTLAGSNTGSLALTGSEMLVGTDGPMGTGMTGPLTINGGRLDVQTLTALGAPATITVGSQGGNSQLHFNGTLGLIGTITYGSLANPTVPASQVNYVLSGTGGYSGDPGAISVENAANIVLPNNISLTAASAIQVDATSSLTLGGNITGNGGLQLEGPGTITETGTNSYTGGTTIKNTNVIFTSAANFPVAGAITSNKPLSLNYGTVGAPLVVGAINASAGLTVAGNVQIASGSGPSTVSSLTIVPGDSLDITRNTLTINFTGGDPTNTIKGYLQSAYAGGAFTGTGLTSSAVEAEVASAKGTTKGTYSIGYIDGNTDGAVATNNGVGANQFFISPELVADGNLDGKVDFNDLLILAQNTGSVTADWVHGDFNFDSKVDFNDLLLLAQNLNQTNGTVNLSGELPASFEAEWALAQAEVRAAGGAESVPEPATTSLIAVGAAGLLARRRRRAN